MAQRKDTKMKKYQNKTPDEVIKMVTIEIIQRSIKLGKKHKRVITISKTSGGKGTDVNELNPKTPSGKINLEKFLTPIRRHYTFSGLGSIEESNSINWRVLNLPFGRRILLVFQVGLSFFLKGTSFKNKLYRWMGVHVGRGAEIMQLVWLDHFRPELIFIGENTLMGAFTRLTVHAYEGSGKFRYGLIEIGNNCTIGAGTGMGPIQIEDNSRTLPGATLSPYLSKIKSGSIVGWDPPTVKEPKS
jgi:acetyltransferase-like isoleucine patch superfamily enzyme